MSDTEARAVTTIQSTPQQVLSDMEIGAGPMAQCSSCARSVGETARSSSPSPPNACLSRDLVIASLSGLS